MRSSGQVGMPARSMGQSRKPGELLRRAAKRVLAGGMRDVVWSLFRGILILGISTVILYPILTKVSSSLMSEADVLDQSVKWIPRRLSSDNYVLAYKVMNYRVALVRSLGLAFVVSLLQLASCLVVGYGFARFRFIGREFFFALVTLTLIVPPQMTMIPQYLSFRFFNIFGLLGPKGLNLLESYWPFILTSATASGLKNGLFIFISRQFFRGIPRDLEDAARVDGAGPIRTFVSIMVPASVPAMVVIFLFSFVWQYNDTFFTNLYLSGAEDFLPFNLSALPYQYNTWQLRYTGKYVSAISESTVTNAGMIMYLAPLLIMYILLQRQFVESIERTGMVG